MEGVQLGVSARIPSHLFEAFSRKPLIIFGALKAGLMTVLDFSGRWSWEKIVTVQLFLSGAETVHGKGSHAFLAMGGFNSRRLDSIRAGFFCG